MVSTMERPVTPQIVSQLRISPSSNQSDPYAGAIAALKSDAAAYLAMRNAIGLGFERLGFIDRSNGEVTERFTLVPLAADFWGISKNTVSVALSQNLGFDALGKTHAETVKESNQIREKLGSRTVQRQAVLVPSRVVLVLGLAADTTKGELLRRSLKLPNPTNPISYKAAMKFAGAESEQKKYESKSSKVPATTKATPIANKPEPQTEEEAIAQIFGQKPVIHQVAERMIEESAAIPRPSSSLVSPAVAAFLKPQLEVVRQERDELKAKVVELQTVLNEKEAIVDELEALVG